MQCTITSGLLCKLLPSDHVLLLVVHELNGRRIERLLQLGQVDLWTLAETARLSLPFHVDKAAEKLASVMLTTASWPCCRLLGQL